MSGQSDTFLKKLILEIKKNNKGNAREKRRTENLLVLKAVTLRPSDSLPDQDRKSFSSATCIQLAGLSVWLPMLQVYASTCCLPPGFSLYSPPVTHGCSTFF
jgi:hypothetical protein